MRSVITRSNVPSKPKHIHWYRSVPDFITIMSQAPKGFHLRGAIKEHHRHPIYGMAWSPHTHVESCHDGEYKQTISYFATCAGPHASIYEVVTTHKSGSGAKTLHKAQPPSLRQVYRDVDDGETFYTCAFGGRGTGSPVGFSPVGAVINEPDEDGFGRDTSKIVHFGFSSSVSDENDERANSKSPQKRRKTDSLEQDNPFLFPFSSTQDGPPLLCLAGTRGIIKVIDTVRRSLFITLSAHTDEITDLQFSPTNEWLLLSASYDESIRLWNLRRGTNVAVFTGHDGHRRQVLSVAWHFSGHKFASCAMDNTIKLWNVKDASNESAVCVEAAIEASEDVMPNDFPDIKVYGGKPKQVETKFKPVIQQTPYFSTNKVHTDYVDCVQFVGDLILSKSVHNKVVLWKPLLEKNAHHDENQTDNEAESESSPKIPSAIFFLREFTLSHCDSWFIRFHSPSPYHRILALGNQRGEVKVWHIGGEKGCNPEQKFYCNLTTSGVNGVRSSGNQDNSGSTVRMVKFSPDASCLVAVCDDATVWMWEAS